MPFVFVNRRRVVRVTTVAAAVAALTACDRPATAPDASLTALAAKGTTNGGGPLPIRYVLPGSSSPARRSSTWPGSI